MTSAREHLAVVSETLRLAVSTLKNADEGGASRIADLGALPLSEAAARLKEVAALATIKAVRVLEVAEAAEAAAARGAKAAELEEAVAAAAAAVAALTVPAKPPLTGNGMYAIGPISLRLHDRISAALFVSVRCCLPLRLSCNYRLD